MRSPAIPSEPRAPRELYEDNNPRSAMYHQRAADILPGGTTRTTIFLAPYPACVVSGKGSHIYDLDGNERIDFLNNYSSLILGHAFPPVVEAVADQLSRGSAFAAPTERELELAERLRMRAPSLEKIHFTNSGTEATMFAMRLARAFTGRSRIGRFVGGYHGTHDYALASGSLGVPPAASQLMLDLPYNDEERTERLIREHKDDLAAVIIEPILGSGGIVPANHSFLSLLRAITERYGILLIFDEIITFRVAYGGAQAHYGITPDLTTLGKIIGGGFALAAFGGRGDIMELLDQRRPGSSMPHGGTFNGNPVAAIAGSITLDHLTPATIDSLNALCALACEKLRIVFSQRQVPVQVTSVGSLFNLHWSTDPVVDYDSAQRGNNPVLYELVLQLMNEGICLAPRGMGCMSTPMTEGDIDDLVAAVDRALDVLESAGVAMA